MRQDNHISWRQRNNVALRFLLHLSGCFALFFWGSCTWFDEGPVDDKPHFELWYTISGESYHVRKNNKYPVIWTPRVKDAPIETLNPCNAPSCFQDKDGLYCFRWELDNPMDLTLFVRSDTSYFIIHHPYQIMRQYIRFAKEFAPSELCLQEEIELLDSLSHFMFERNDKDGIYISFEFALQFESDTVYVRDGYVEAHPNRNGNFAWDISKYIHDE